MRGAAHRVPDPAARASLPAAPHASHWFCGTRAVPRCECGAGRGRWRSGPGGSWCLVGSLQVLCVRLSPSSLSLIISTGLSLAVFSLSLYQCHSLQVSGALSLSLCFPDSAVCVPSPFFTPLLLCLVCPSFFLATLSSVQRHCPCAPCPLNPPLCVSGGAEVINT